MIFISPMTSEDTKIARNIGMELNITPYMYIHVTCMLYLLIHTTKMSQLHMICTDCHLVKTHLSIYHIGDHHDAV